MPKKDPTDNHNQLGRLMERYKALLRPPQASVEKECVAVIKELTGINLATEQVSYTVSTRTLIIKAPSVIRSELSMKRTIILETLKGRLGEKSAPIAII